MAETTRRRSRHTGSNGRSSADPVAGFVLVAATLAVGLIAGFFFDWAVAIMPTLAETDDATFVDVMLQSITTINTSVPFLLALSGGFIGTAVAAVLLYRVSSRTAFRWTLAALAFYVVAVFITFGVHFPLHEALANAGHPDAIADLAAVRGDFEAPWVNAHLVRTAAVILAFVALCRALWLGRGTDASTVKAR